MEELPLRFDNSKLAGLKVYGRRRKPASPRLAAPTNLQTISVIPEFASDDAAPRTHVFSDKVNVKSGSSRRNVNSSHKPFIDDGRLRCLNCAMILTTQNQRCNKISAVLGNIKIKGTTASESARFSSFDVKITEALDVVFGLTKGSEKLGYTLNEERESLCFQCTTLLAHLYTSFIEFVDCAEPPSLLGKILAFNNSLNEFHSSRISNLVEQNNNSGNVSEPELNCRSSSLADDDHSQGYDCRNSPEKSREKFGTNSMRPTAAESASCSTRPITDPQIDLVENPDKEIFTYSTFKEISSTRLNEATKKIRASRPVALKSTTVTTRTQPRPRKKGPFKPVGPINPLIAGHPISQKCNVCGYFVQRFIEMHQHFLISHPERSDDIETLSVLIDEQKRRIRKPLHKGGERTDKRKCPECDEYVSARKFKGHKKSHLEQKYKCIPCGTDYRTVRLLQAHNSIEHKKPRSIREKKQKQRSKPPRVPHGSFECPVCPDRTFNRSTNLKMHLEAAHRPKITVPKKYKHKERECPVCGKVYQTSISYLKHCDSHREKRFKCELCRVQITTEKRLKWHMLYKHAEKPYVCPHPSCGRSFRGEWLLRVHSAVHNTPRVVASAFKVPCTYQGCTRIFRNDADLNRHISVQHPVERNFVCEQCGASFKLIAGLRIHVRKVHLKLGRKTLRLRKPNEIITNTCQRNLTKPALFKCPRENCGRILKDKSAYYAHRRTHFDQLVFNCNFCPKGFPTANGLHQHLKSNVCPGQNLSETADHHSKISNEFIG